MRGKLIVGMVALAVLAACGGDKVKPLGQVQTKDQFKIKADCNQAGQVSVDVPDWTIGAAAGQNIKWQLNGGNATIQIVPNDKNKWPFEETDIRPTSAGFPTKIKAGSSGFYRFKINITCQGSPSPNVVIDPDIFVN